MSASVPGETPPAASPSALYIHVPFCTARCQYCDFATAPYRGGDVGPYIEALAAERARRFPEGFAPETVYLGGGTPTALSLGELERLLGIFAPEIRACGEVTVEANPETLDAEKVRLLREGGVTRVSLGAQSFDDARLRFLGRRHTADDVRRAFALCREAGFPNLSLDLLFAVPGSGAEDLRRNVAEAAALGPEGLSLYALGWERRTAFSVRAARGEIEPIGEEEGRALYLEAIEIAERSGWRQYEISNFARPGFESRHNLVYWRNEGYLGLGSAAVSYVGGRRVGNEERPRRYIERIAAGGDAEAFSERLEPAARARETLVFGLRLVEGLDEKEFRRRTGFSLEETGGEALSALVDAGRIVREGGRVRLARDSLVVADAIAAELV